MADRINFQGDHFVHSIDVCNDAGEFRQRIAGADNVAAANIAFSELRHYHSRFEILVLRDGARVMRRSRGFGRDRERFMETKPGRETEWKDWL